MSCTQFLLGHLALVYFRRDNCNSFSCLDLAVDAAQVYEIAVVTMQMSCSRSRLPRTQKLSSFLATNSAILCFRADPLRSSRIRLWRNVALKSAFWILPPWSCKLQLFLVVGTAGTTCNCYGLSARFVYSGQQCTSLCYVIRSHIRRVLVCWAVTCHLHF